MSEQANPWAVILYSRALSAADPSLVQIRFHAALLDRYRQSGMEVKRTDTVGRVRKQGGWSLDFGIGPDDRTIHCSYGDLIQNVPQEEMQYWAAHVAQSELSENFCKMRLHPGSCLDDGDLRDW
jgi:hypothetical protein